MRESLVYIGSNAIEQFIAANPINWHDKSLACRGGIGDQAGMPPTPMVYEFLSLLKKKQSLFTQSEYSEHCLATWEFPYEWPAMQNPAYCKGVEAKLYRNAYPAMIDALHVWSLMVEANWFDTCILDSLTDAVSKHDLVVSRNGSSPVAIDIYAGSSSSLNDRRYKQQYRKSASGIIYQTYEVPLSMDRPVRQPGNKRWFCLKDFEQIYVDYHQGSLWDTAIVRCTCGHHLKTKRHVTTLPPADSRRLFDWKPIAQDWTGKA